MKTPIFALMLGLLTLAGCSDDDQGLSGAHSEFKYNYVYTDHPIAQVDPFARNTNYKAFFTDNKVTHVKGMVFEGVGQATGGIWNAQFSSSIYRDIIYSGNTAEILQRLPVFQAGVEQGEKQTITFDTEQRMVQKIRHSRMYPLDTVYYNYQNGLLKSYEVHNRRLISRSEVYYNGQANVDSIVTRPTIYVGDHYIYDPQSKKRTVEIFGDYDQTPSPFGRLMILEETFFRSLSVNNYAKFRRNHYNMLNELEGYGYVNLQFFYRNGIINWTHSNNIFEQL